MPSPQIDTDLVAAAIIADDQQASSEHSQHGSCLNCGATLAGKYCHQCGQVSHLHRSLFHIAEELLHGLFHFDTKMWRTIPALFFHPGRLTREYIDGKRVRYVAPLPLYLFLIFLMFFVFSMTAHFSGQDEKEAASDKAVVSDTHQDKSATSDKTVVPTSAVASATASPADETKERAITYNIPEIGAIPKIVADLESDSETYKSAPQWLQEKLNHAAANPELVLYKMKGSASKFALLLLPLALPVMWLLFPFSRKHLMFDHCVFILYSLSFAACAMMILSLISLGGFADTGFMLVSLTMPLHMYRQLKGAYLLSRFQAIWRTFALISAAFVSLAFYATALLAFSL